MQTGLLALSDMALFVEVVQAGGFRTAAARLDMPASTLSRRIALMERRLGTTLVLRTTRSVALAEAAKPYFDQCIKVLESAARAHSLLLPTTKQAARLRISMPVDLGVDLLGPLIASYAASRAWLSIDFDLTYSTRDLFRDPVDIAFRIGKPLDDRVIARRVGDIRAGLFASPGYLRTTKPIRCPDDLVRAKCLNLSGSQGAMPWMVGTRRWPHAPGEAKFSSNSVAMVRALAELGHGIALMPVHIAQSSVRSQKLEPVLGKELVQGWHIFALSATRNLTPEARDIIAHVREKLSALPTYAAPNLRAGKFDAAISQVG